MTQLLYNLVVHAYGLLIRAAAFQNHKAKRWVLGRKNWRNHLKTNLAPFQQQKKIWVHCASYGEFEQGRPLMEQIRIRHPHHVLVLSFFSPSGYEAFQNWHGADVIIYLPLDTKKNARDFLKILQPSTAIFIKYEFWLHYLHQLKQNKIPSYLVSALFKGHHPFFKWYGGIFRDSLHTFVRLLVQDQESKHLLAKIGIDRVQVLGDTRFDRVLDIKATPDDDSIIREFKGNSKLIIAGSTWPKDETLVLQAFESLRAQGCKLIIAPHEVEARFTINTIKKINAHGFSYSIYKQDPDTTVDVMIIDTIGRLSKLYRYADLAYVGGGFNGGLHNVLEPTVYGIPVAFYAENYGKFNEAVDLITLGVAKTAADANQLAATWQKQLFDESYRKQVKEDSQSYFNVNGYVTEKVLQAMAL